MKAVLTIRPTPLALALAAALPAVAFAAPGSNSAYVTDSQNTHVEDATSEGVNQVNMITCVMTSMRPDALVNQGNYVALVDQNKCDPNKRSSTSNSSGDSSASNAPSYMSVAVNSSRASNTDPMRVKAWVDQKDKDSSATIFVNVSASESPSTTNPYGVFRMDYCGIGGSGPCMMQGYLQGGTDGITYFETEAGGGGGGGGGTRALRLTTSGTDSGAGALQMSQGGQSTAYSFAYNANYFRRSDGTNDQCFSRDATDPDTGMSVWSYSLYDADTGARVDRMSGFPIDYTAPDGTVYHGQMGYWGLWMPQGVTVPDGATVQRVQYTDGQAPTKTDYTLVEAAGRLMKYTKQTRTLASMDKIHFQTWVGDTTNFFSGAQPNQQYEMYWDDTSGAFKVTGVVQCNNGPCETKTLDSEQTVQASFFSSMGGVRGYSQSLGGQVFIPLQGVTGSVQSTGISVIYRTQDIVYPADMPSTLYCLRECPTAASMGAYFTSGSTAASPFVASTFNTWGPVDSSGVVAYSTDASSALLKDNTGSSVTFTDANTLQQYPQYQSGVNTGRMVTSLAAAQCADDPSHYCDWQIEQADVYYQWQTGPNQWNQFAALKDSSGTIVHFDAPLQVNYTVPVGAAYGDYAGKTIVLQYGGFGQLWGIPGYCVSPLTNDKVSCDTSGSRYVPAFVIPYDPVLGRVDNSGTPLLVKWLDREIRFAKKDVSVCTGAGLALPSGLTLPTAGGLNNPADSTSAIYIGSKPVVTDPPRVIQGVVEY